jgi:tetrahydromethanopterin S-methyltransferase subunit E
MREVPLWVWLAALAAIAYLMRKHVALAFFTALAVAAVAGETVWGDHAVNALLDWMANAPSKLGA